MSASNPAPRPPAPNTRATAPRPYFRNGPLIMFQATMPNMSGLFSSRRIE